MIEDMIKEFIPKEGDIVKIVKPYGNYERNYMLAIWPNENNIILNSSGNATVIGVDFLVDFNGEYHDYYSSFGFNMQEDTLMKPNMYDIFEFSRILLNHGLRYNRKKKQIIKVENYESNR